MRRTAVFCGFLALGFAAAAHAQMGMDMFKRPSITKAFNPVVGKGAEYETTSKTGGKSRSMQMGIVGKDSVDGKDGYWFEMVMAESSGEPMISKTLITTGDFQPHRAIMQIPGKGAMEMPVNMTARNRQQVDDKMSEWHSAGTETITVPAGTFSCDHWKNDKDGSEAWTSGKVVPFGLVKEVETNSSMTLVKVIDDFPDQIKGPVQQFNMQQMMQQMQQQRQQPNP